MDIEPRRIRLQSNSYTTNTLLDTVTAATVQVCCPMQSYAFPPSFKLRYLGLGMSVGYGYLPTVRHVHAYYFGYGYPVEKLDPGAGSQGHNIYETFLKARDFCMCFPCYK